MMTFNEFQQAAANEQPITKNEKIAVHYCCKVEKSVGGSVQRIRSNAYKLYKESFQNGEIPQF